MKIKMNVCGGCNAKIGAQDLTEILSKIPIFLRPEVICGFEGSDDGGIIKLNEEQALVVTLDFFPPPIKDANLFGQIAAANSLSDIYAMGGEPICAMNIVCFPETEDKKILEEILNGGAKKLKEAEATLLGGHSVYDENIKYGMAVIGLVHPKKMWTNTGAKPGDQLLLTKPLGASIVCAGYEVDEIENKDYEFTVNKMASLNKMAAKLFSNYKINALTDITGFGLLGHLKEMLDNEYSANIYKDDIPIYPGAKTAASNFLMTAGGQRNRKFLGADVKFQFDDFGLEEIVFDPQTSGGLLAAVPNQEAEKILKEAKEKEIEIYRIGEITDKKEKLIYLI
ncbi:MAG: selenide, water dikinase SelD [Tissierellia bacterium]|nr:selenide, water dikinase SelD [Tissierellia bacterium]